MTVSKRYLFLLLALCLLLGLGIYASSRARVVKPPPPDEWQLQRADLRAKLAWLESVSREGEDTEQLFRFGRIVETRLKALIATSADTLLAQEVEPLLSTLLEELALGEAVTGTIAQLDQLLQPPSSN